MRRILQVTDVLNEIIVHPRTLGTKSEEVVHNMTSHKEQEQLERNTSDIRRNRTAATRYIIRIFDNRFSHEGAGRIQTASLQKHLDQTSGAMQVTGENIP